MHSRVVYLHFQCVYRTVPFLIRWILHVLSRHLVLCKWEVCLVRRRMLRDSKCVGKTHPSRYWESICNCSTASYVLPLHIIMFWVAKRRRTNSSIEQWTLCCDEKTWFSLFCKFYHFHFNDFSFFVYFVVHRIGFKHLVYIGCRSIDPYERFIAKKFNVHLYGMRVSRVYWSDEIEMHNLWNIEYAVVLRLPWNRWNTWCDEQELVASGTYIYSYCISSLDCVWDENMRALALVWWKTVVEMQTKTWWHPFVEIYFWFIAFSLTQPLSLFSFPLPGALERFSADIAPLRRKWTNSAFRKLSRWQWETLIPNATESTISALT